MSLSSETRQQVRQRAAYACEFCGVSEKDVGGMLSIDHFHPVSKGGNDSLENLLYCCVRCNLYKGDYHAESPSDTALWNPRLDPFSKHFLTLENGELQPLTAIGEFSLIRLRLNRKPLIDFRIQKLAQSEDLRLLNRYAELIEILEQLNRQLTSLTEEQQVLLEEQQALLRSILGRLES